MKEVSETCIKALKRTCKTSISRESTTSFSIDSESGKKIILSRHIEEAKILSLQVSVAL